MDVLIRKATTDDLLAIQKLSQELFQAELVRDPLLNMNWSMGEEGRKIFYARITEENRFCFVAEIDGMIVGYATGSILPTLAWRPVKRLEMENLIVSEHYRNQKIGDKLTQQVFDYAKSLGMERVMVSAYAANEHAIRFYKRAGFIPDSLQLEKVL